MKSFDARRMAELVSAPGIDTSVWLQLARVDDDDEAFSWVEGTGWLVDVTCHGGKLDQVPATCRVASSLASAGELSSCPIEKGAEVLVAFPGDGDPNDSPVIVAQMSNQGSSPVPLAIFVATPSPEPIDEAFARATLFLVTSKDVKLDVGEVFRLQAQQEVGLHAQLVTLADPTAAEAFVRGTTFATALNVFLVATNVMANTLAGVPGMSASVATWQTAIANMIASLVPGQSLSTRIRGE